jgi:hypothetical protein
MAAVDAAAHGALRWSAVAVPGGPMLPGGEPAVIGDVFAAPGGQVRALLVNLSDVVVSLPPDAPWLDGASYEQVTNIPTAQLTVVPTPQSGTALHSGLSLSPYSLTLVGASLPQ